MGGALGIPTDDIARDTKEVLEKFAALHMKQTIKGVVKDAIAPDEEEDKDPKGEFLAKCTGEVQVIRQGWFEKRGAISTSYKRRFFVLYWHRVLDEAGNLIGKPELRLMYSKTEVTDLKTAKPAGFVNLAHYKVKENTKKDVQADHGEFSITMKPGDDRRTWYFKFESAVELSRWKTVLERACQEALPFPILDAVHFDAFVDAFKDLRWDLRIWRRFTPNVGEVEMLAGTIMEYMNNHSLSPFWAKFSYNEKLKKKAVSMIRSQVTALATPAVNTCFDAAKKAMEPLKAKLGEIVGPVRAAKDKMLEQSRPIILEPIHKVVKTIQRKRLMPIAKGVVGPLLFSLKQINDICMSKTHELLAMPEEEFKKKFAEMVAAPWNEIHESYDQVKRILENPVLRSSIRTSFDVNSYEWKIFWFMKFEQLFRNYLTTVALRIDEASIHARLEKSSKKLLIDGLVELMMNASETKIENTFDRKLRPLLSAIDALPEAITDYIDIHDIIVTSVKKCVVDKLTEGLESYVEENPMPTELPPSA